MDNLGWLNPPNLRNESAIQPFVSSNQNEYFLESNCDYNILSGKVELYEAFFNSSLELQGIRMQDTMNSNFHGVSEMVEPLAPSLDSTNSTLDMDPLMQHQEALGLTADSVVPASGTGASWGDVLTSQLCSFSPITTPIFTNPLCGLSENFCSSSELKVFGNIGDDEDGVSTIFLDGQNIRNLSSAGNVSSGESSENYGPYRSSKEADYHCSNLEEAASGSSSNPDPSHRGCSRSRSNTKRKFGEDESKVGENNHLPSNLQQSSSSTTKEGGFQIVFGNSSKPKKPRSERHNLRSSSIDFQQEDNIYEPDTEAIAQVKEMIYRAAALRPVNLGLEDAIMEKPKRKNVRISSDPQTIAARCRRERISERLRVLQRLVPGGSKMDTASMLDEAANYLKFLRSQVSVLETLGSPHTLPFSPPFNQPFTMKNLFSHPNLP